MKVIAAYLLAQLGGNTSPTSDDLKKILSSVGADIDEEKIELLLSQVKGKDIAELIAAGKQQLAATSMAFGGGGGGAVDTNNVAAAQVGVEEKKEEKKVEEKEESDDEDYNFSLFD